MRWRLIKSYFSRKLLRSDSEFIPEGRAKKREWAVWQERFWEHLIRDDEDFARHVDYIHYNPVKHGLVKSPADWKHSSFHEYLKMGVYPVDWGGDLEIIGDHEVRWE